MIIKLILKIIKNLAIGVFNIFFVLSIHELGHALFYYKHYKNIPDINIGFGKNFLTIKFKKFKINIKILFFLGGYFKFDNFNENLIEENKEIFLGGIIFNFFAFFILISIWLIIIIKNYNLAITDYLFDLSFYNFIMFVFNFIPFKLKMKVESNSVIFSDGYYLFKYDKAINILKMIEEKNFKTNSIFR